MSREGPNNFMIAALGASAGGLEPLEAFFRNMPAETGIAFVIVQHLAPDHPTALPQILARHTQMPVEQAEDNTPVAPNRVYVIPPNATLTIENGLLCVKVPAEARGARTPIDSFFSSLAQDRGENAVCILLSGTGTDGTLGLRAIKEFGGMAMAQSLDSAKYDAIIRSAIATGLVDHVLPVEEMPHKLVEYAAHLISLSGKSSQLHEQLTAQMGKIHSILKRRAGHDFSQYKENTIVRRLDRRMKAAQIETVEHYLELLERQPEEVDRLFSDLLIGVTQFFRDREAFETLKTQVIPKMFANNEAGGQVRACVVGCATGEEVYSIAILLCEHASKLESPPKIQVFGTDIDERSLATARKGLYPESIAQNVSTEYLDRFFIKVEGGYQIKRELREVCLFSTHSFIKDPPFSRLDLISCRNVMIYLGQELQQKIIPLFHYALRPGGYLFLGPSESAASHRELFGTVDKKHRIFRRVETLPPPAFSFPLAAVSRPSLDGGRPRPLAPDVERNLPRQLERIILQRYRPACVTVKENGEAVYFSGQVSRYLEQPTGSPATPNVINMARDGLRIPLRTALHRAVSDRARIVQRQISVKIDGGVGQVDLTVEPVAEFHAANLYMVVFEDVVPASSHDGSPAASPADAGTEETIRHLEGELRSAQETAQAMFEELESSNEELQSANEEFQTTNEELETSKEELQSFNEELETVNGELGRKVSELDHSNSDLQNLLNSTQIATLFLDKELRIRSFTPAAGSIFQLIAADTGRPITDLAAQLPEMDLALDVRAVLSTLVPRERQLSGADGRHFQMHILPYRTVRDVIEGVVLTFTDVTPLKQAERDAINAQAYAESIVNTVHEPLLVLDARMRVQSASKAFYDVFKISPQSTIDTSIFELGSRQWDIPELRQLLVEILPAGKMLEGYEVEKVVPGVGRRIMRLTARPVQREASQSGLILLTIEDVTERRLAAVALRDSQARYRTLFDSCPIAIYSCESSGVIREFNPRAAELWGREPKPGDTDERFCGSFKLYRPDGTFMPHDQCPMAEVLAGTIPEARDMEVRIERPNGSFVTVIVNIVVLKDEGGAITGAINCFVDVTERKRADEALAKSREELRNRNEDLKHFSYAASHDLQEPLRMVTSYTQLLAREYKGKLDPRADQFILRAVDGAQRMEALLRDLRAFWSVDEKQILNLVTVDCNLVLEKALAVLEIPVREAGAVVTHDPLPMVVTEELPLVLLFQNLIGNAIKYRHSETQPRIHLSSQKDRGNWRITVTDNGIGIEPEYLETVFAPFKRLHGKEIPGTGMGLAICQKIVERYGGRIWVESSERQGSAFHFTLPAKNGGA